MDALVDQRHVLSPKLLNPIRPAVTRHTRNSDPTPSRVEHVRPMPRRFHPRRRHLRNRPLTRRDVLSHVRRSAVHQHTIRRHPESVLSRGIHQPRIDSQRVQATQRSLLVHHLDHCRLDRSKRRLAEDGGKQQGYHGSIIYSAVSCYQINGIKSFLSTEFPAFKQGVCGYW